MPAPDAFGKGLDVAGQLDLAIDSFTCTAMFKGDVIVLALPDVRTALALRTRLPQAIPMLRQAQPYLGQAGLQIAIEIAGRRVGQFREGLASNWLSRRLKIDPFRIEARGLLAALLSRRSREMPR